MAMGIISLLPTELILEIVSYFNNINAHLTEHDNKNREALRALSQTSRVFKNICLPLFWARIDDAMYGNSEKKLERLMIHLIENPVLAAYVRLFKVYIIAVHREKLVYNMVTCLCSLPNMHTLCLHLYNRAAPHPFAGARFPQIRTLVIPSCHARFFVPCCPKVRTVISLDPVQGDSLNGVFDESGETLEVLDGFMMSPATIQYLVKATPNLRIIKFPEWINPDDLVLFEPLKKLHTIEMSKIQYQTWDQREVPIPDATLDTWMTMAKQVLTGNEGRHGHIHGGKRIWMSYRWFDHTTLDKNQRPLVRTRFEDIEVD